MRVFTTEITSDTLTSDNPIHQRLLKPYYYVADKVTGDLLEVGCGEGRGIDLVAGKSQSYTGVDKIGPVIERLEAKHPQYRFLEMVLPPMAALPDAAFDTVISFQVIEHIHDDSLFLREIYRVLRPGGKAYITTPNIKMTLTRNPWHVREYTAAQLKNLCTAVFDTVDTMGIAGNDKVMAYYEANKKSVERIVRWDVFNLQYRLPSSLLRIPYDLLNRLNRSRLQSAQTGIVADISHEDYLITAHADAALDLFYVLHKNDG
jgi:SAM-dependent methyltransferase